MEDPPNQIVHLRDRSKDGTRRKISNTDSITQTTDQVVSGKGDQAANPKGGLFLLVTAHGAIALFNPPTNGAFIRIVGAIQERFALEFFPGAVESQARLGVPTIHISLAI